MSKPKPQASSGPTPDAAKPTVFIGSSAEAEPMARHFHRVLGEQAMPVLWRHSPVFKPTISTLDGLLSAIERYDFALFILRPEDRLVIRGRTTVSFRDNVLFEFGLFLGQLGADRVAAVMQAPDRDGTDVRIPSDLEGIGISTFRSSKNENALISSISQAIHPFLDQIQQKGRRQRKIRLIRSFGFDPGSRSFSMTLSAVALYENRIKLKDCDLVPVVRVKDQGVPYEQDVRITVGRRRRFSETDRDDVDFSIKLGSRVVVKRGNIVECYLLLIPPDADVAGAKTIAEMIHRGCDVIDSCGKMVTSIPRKTNPKGKKPVVDSH